MDVRVFELDESIRDDLESLLFQLSGIQRTVSLENYSDTFCIGVFDHEKLVGFAELFLLRKTTFVMAHLEDVVVLEAYRGQGLGTLLIEKVISVAKKEGAKVINLTTRLERKAALSLFESFGFIAPGNQTLRLTLED